MRRMIRTSRLQTLFRIGIAIAVTLLVAAAVTLVLRKSQYDQLLSDYEATRQAAALIEWYVETGEVPELPGAVTGFGLYNRTGDPVFARGTAPAALPPPREYEEVVRTGDQLRLIRPLAGRFGLPGIRGQRGMMASPISQQFVLLDYDLSTAAGRQRLENGALVASGVLIAGVLLVLVALYRRLQLAQRESEREGRLAQLGSAARTLAHEIRNPLTAAQMQTELLRRDLLRPELNTNGNGAASPDSSASRRLDVLDEELTRIKDLTDQVREFIKSGSGNPTRMPLAATVQAVADRFPFVVHVTPLDSDVFVRIDDDRLRSICGNLIRNAHEATQSGEPVEVTFAHHRDRVELRVADRGEGIPGSQRERIFDPFFTTKEHGSGVGLAITRRFVEEASGQIEAKPRAGGGTEMIVTLPEDK